VNEGKMKRIRMHRSAVHAATDERKSNVRWDTLMDGYVWFQSEYFLIFILHCRLNWPLCSTLQNVDMAQPRLVPPYRPRVRPPLKHDHIMPTLASHQEVCRHAHRMETPTAIIKSRRAYPLPLIQINLSLGSSMSSGPFEPSGDFSSCRRIHKKHSDHQVSGAVVS
jgi:hypothetical protein